jgi:protein-tyrosine phosphatase
MIDIHCHILPGIDDGPADLAGSLAMARLAAADGIHKLFATPHVYPDGLQREVIEAAVMALQQAVDAEGLALRIYPGADASSRLGGDGLVKNLLHNGPYLLVEFPHTHLPGDAPDLIAELVGRGTIPIITHPERNPDLVRSPDLLLPLLEAGGLVQVTAECLTGGFGAECRACARHLLRRGWVHFLASDGHAANWRPPRLSLGLKAARKLIGKEKALALVLENPARIIAGERL